MGSPPGADDGGREREYMEQKKIEVLYRLLSRAEEERDDKAISALRWAIFTLEN